MLNRPMSVIQKSRETQPRGNFHRHCERVPDDLENASATSSRNNLDCGGIQSLSILRKVQDNKNDYVCRRYGEAISGWNFRWSAPLDQEMISKALTKTSDMKDGSVSMSLNTDTEEQDKVVDIAEHHRGMTETDFDLTSFHDIVKREREEKERVGSLLLR